MNTQGLMSNIKIMFGMSNSIMLLPPIYELVHSLDNLSANSKSASTVLGSVQEFIHQFDLGTPLMNGLQLENKCLTLYGPRISQWDSVLLSILMAVRIEQDLNVTREAHFRRADEQALISIPFSA